MCDDSIGFVRDLNTDIPTGPSETMYYDQYLYRVEVLSYTKNKRDLRNFKFSVIDYCEENFEYKIRTNFSKTKKLLYISDFEDLVKFLDSVFKITAINGPINRQHFELLYTRDYRCEVREKLYYNKYDSKVSVWPQRKKGGGWSILGSMANSEFAQQKAELLEFLKDNVSTYRLNSRSYTYVDHDFFINQSEFLELLPFIKLQYPDLRFMVTGCILK